MEFRIATVNDIKEITILMEHSRNEGPVRKISNIKLSKSEKLITKVNKH